MDFNNILQKFVYTNYYLEQSLEIAFNHKLHSKVSINTGNLHGDKMAKSFLYHSFPLSLIHKHHYYQTEKNMSYQTLLLVIQKMNYHNFIFTFHYSNSITTNSFIKGSFQLANRKEAIPRH